jgi:hypothetical protein
VRILHSYFPILEISQKSDRVLSAVHLPTFLDNKFHWLAIPGLIRAIASLQALFFVVLLFNSAAIEMITPDWTRIMQGEIWRVFSFILIPAVIPPEAGSGDFTFPVVFIIIATMIAYLENDILEHTLGTTRTSLYVFATVLCQGTLINGLAYLLRDADGGALATMRFGSHYHLALFFAFATVAPHYTFRVMFILPVKVWILAAISGVIIFISCLSFPLYFIYYGIVFLPYLCWAIPLAIRWSKTRHQVQKRRNKFTAAKASVDNTLHCCIVCEKTEISDPNAEFRVAEDGEEYCLDHLP